MAHTNYKEYNHEVNIPIIHYYKGGFDKKYVGNCKNLFGYPKEGRDNIDGEYTLG